MLCVCTSFHAGSSTSLSLSRFVGAHLRVIVALLRSSVGLCSARVPVGWRCATHFAARLPKRPPLYC